MENRELWKKIAEHFGVELEEEFKLKFKDEDLRYTYRFADGLQFYADKKWRKATEFESDLLHGDNKLTIVKLPWKPKHGELYYYIELAEHLRIHSDMWQGNTKNEMLYQIHNCFRSEDETTAKLRKILEVMENG